MSEAIEQARQRLRPAPAPSTPAAAAAPGAEPAPEPEPAPALEPEPEPEPEGILAKLPPRHEGDPEVEILLPNDEQGQATVERINQLKNQARAGAQVAAARVELERQAEALQDQADSMVVDPLEWFTQQRMPPAERAKLALYLLADPEVYGSELGLGRDGEGLGMDAVLGQLMDPDGRDVLVAKLETARVREARARAAQLADRRESRREGQRIQAVIAALVPEGLSEEDAGAFLHDANRDVMDALRAGHLPLKDTASKVPLVLAARLRRYGMSEQHIEARLRRLTLNGSQPPTPGAPPLAPAPGMVRAPATPKIADLQAAAERRAAVATPGGGLGVPAPGGTPGVTKTMTVQQAIAAVRARPRARSG